MIGAIVCILLIALAVWSFYYSSMNMHKYVTDTKTVNLETNETSMNHKEGMDFDNAGIFVLGIFAMIIAVIIGVVVLAEN